MENFFIMIVKKMMEVGIYDFLIFAIGLAIFYGILKRIKFFDSIVINSVLAFAIAFLLFGFPVILNYSLVMPMAKFFMQTFVWILVFFVGMLISSFFYPDLPKFLVEHFSSRSMLSVGIAAGIFIAILSGMTSFLWMEPSVELFPRSLIPGENMVIAGGVIIFVVMLIIAGSVGVRSG